MADAAGVGGYVLAGGKSSRMGRDKALLELGGKPLIEHAVKKLRRTCDDVQILSGNPELAGYAAVVRDLRPGCGPLSGMEAALAHSAHDWSLILPVDLPFVPAALLQGWIAAVLSPKHMPRIAMFTLDGRAQPALCMLHREVAPFIAAAMERGELKLLPALEAAAGALAARHSQPLNEILLELPIAADFQFRDWAGEDGHFPTTEAQDAAAHLWFMNLNTPEDFAEAEAHVAALDS